MDSIRDKIKLLETPDVNQGSSDNFLHFLEAAKNIYHNNGASNGDFNENTLAMIYYKMMQFIYSRDKRQSDVESEEMKFAIEIKNKLFKLGIPYLLICLDGRVFSKGMFGLYGHAYRTPAADIKTEFLVKAHTRNKEIFLIEGRFSRLIDQALNDEKTQVMTEILDSHVGCAAGSLHHADISGKEAYDHGLYEDVKRKKAMAKAMIDYAAIKFPGKRLFVVQTSFNPHDGYCYFGLDRRECLEDSEVLSHGYTGEVLKNLTDKGMIISTRRLVRDGEIQKIMVKYFFNLDYKNDYRQSTFNFWKNIEAMLPEIKPVIENLVMGIYPHLAEDERLQISMLVLANTYSGFLHNHSQAPDSVILVEKPYEYAHHQESLIAVTMNEKGPFDRADAFSVTPDYPQLTDAIHLCRNLIINNRKAGRMSDYEKKSAEQLTSLEHYSTSPVLCLLFERVDVSDEQVAKLRSIDWSDLPASGWYDIEDNYQFTRDYLDKKYPGIPAVVAEQINLLRHRTRELYKPGQKINELLLTGKLMLVCTLADKNRRIIIALPFLKNGY